MICVGQRNSEVIIERTVARCFAVGVSALI